MTGASKATTGAAGTAVLLGAGASFEAHVPLAKALTRQAMKASVQEASDGADPHRLSIALAFVVNAMQRHAIARRVPHANNLEDLPGIEQVVSAVGMLAERADLEVSPFVASWDPAIPAVDPGGRGIEEHAVNVLAQAVMSNLTGAFGGPHTRGRDLAKGLATAVDNYMSSPSIGSGTFAELRRWLTRRVLTDVNQFDRTDATVDYLRPLVRWAATNRAVVATLNYDECMETAAEHENVPLDLAVDQWATTGLLNAPVNTDSLRLLKLHGSIKWCFTERGTFSLIQPGDDWDRQKSVPGIVYGQRGKLRPEGPFLQLLEAFRTELERSANLLVIGYSFGDDHINTLVRNWLTRNEARRMLVVDPDFPRYLEHPYDEFTYDHELEENPGSRRDPRREMWHAFGPGIPRDEPHQAARHDDQVQVPLAPVPARFYFARCKTGEFLDKLGTGPVDMERLIGEYRDDPETVPTYIYSNRSGCGSG